VGIWLPKYLDGSDEALVFTVLILPYCYQVQKEWPAWWYRRPESLFRQGLPVIPSPPSFDRPTCPTLFWMQRHHHSLIQGIITMRPMTKSHTGSRNINPASDSYHTYRLHLKRNLLAFAKDRVCCYLWVLSVSGPANPLYTMHEERKPLF
jgi:hypothetical protein